MYYVACLVTSSTSTSILIVQCAALWAGGGSPQIAMGGKEGPHHRAAPASFFFVFLRVHFVPERALDAEGEPVARDPNEVGVDFGANSGTVRFRASEKASNNPLGSFCASQESIMPFSHIAWRSHPA